MSRYDNDIPMPDRHIQAAARRDRALERAEREAERTHPAADLIPDTIMAWESYVDRLGPDGNLTPRVRDALVSLVRRIAVAVAGDGPGLHERHLRICMEAALDPRKMESADVRLAIDLGAAFVNADMKTKSLVNVLQLILPLAKGYAHAHQVGINAEVIKAAEAVLNQHEATDR